MRRYLHRRVVPKDVAKRYAQWHGGELDEEWIAEDDSLTMLKNKKSEDIAQVANYNLKTEKQEALQRPKRFCFFIKSKDKHPEYYTRFEEFFLALRIGYFKTAWQLLRGKPRHYIFEGNENNPMPF